MKNSKILIGIDMKFYDIPSEKTRFSSVDIPGI